MTEQDEVLAVDVLSDIAAIAASNLNRELTRIEVARFMPPDDAQYLLADARERILTIARLTIDNIEAYQL